MERILEEENLERLTDLEFRCLMVGYLLGFGYEQLADNEAFITFKNEELGLEVKVIKKTEWNFDIMFKKDDEWIVAETVTERKNIPEAIKEHGILVRNEIMMKRGRQLLRQQGL